MALPWQTSSFFGWTPGAEPSSQPPNPKAGYPLQVRISYLMASVFPFPHNFQPEAQVSVISSLTVSQKIVFLKSVHNILFLGTITISAL